MVATVRRRDDAAWIPRTRAGQRPGCCQSKATSVAGPRVDLVRDAPSRELICNEASGLSRAADNEDLSRHVSHPEFHLPRANHRRPQAR